jgi:two-component system sensor histidine kinase MprB
VNRRVTLRARVAVLTAAAVAIAVTVTTAGIYLTIRSQLYDQFEDDLLGRARAAVGGALANPDQLTRLPADALGDARVGVLDTTGTLYYPIGGELPPTSLAELRVATGQANESVRAVDEDDTTLLVVAVPADRGTALVLAESTEGVQQTLGHVGAVSLLIGLLGMIGAGSVGYGVARAGLRPLGALTSATERVATSMDLTPIDSAGAPLAGADEVGRLTASFNVMLSSLAAARDRERQLVADAGHELRTPLTSLRTNLDLLAQAGSSGRPLDPADEQSLLDDVREQLVELGHLVDDLVQLSRGIDPATGRESADLAVIVHDSVTKVARRAHDVRIEQLISPWWVEADVPALSRAVTNLLDNAVKWSPPGGVVIVQLQDGVLTVADEGPGVAPNDRPHVFDRFYRADGARGLPGSGLGLAIVAQAVQQHGGTISVDEAPSGGARFDVLIPGQPEAPSPAQTHPTSS